MDSERAGVLLAAVLIYLRLMQNTPRFFGAIEMWWQLVCLRCRRVTRRLWMRVRNRDWWQSPLPQKCDAFFPAIVSNLRIIKGACHVIHACHARMRTLVRAAILHLRCLHACIFWLKSAYATYVNTIMLAAIMSLIALFRSKYCVYMR